MLGLGGNRINYARMNLALSKDPDTFKQRIALHRSERFVEEEYGIPKTFDEKYVNEIRDD